MCHVEFIAFDLLNDIQGTYLSIHGQVGGECKLWNLFKWPKSVIQMYWDRRDCIILSLGSACHPRVLICTSVTHNLFIWTALWIHSGKIWPWGNPSPLIDLLQMGWLRKTIACSTYSMLQKYYLCRRHHHVSLIQFIRASCMVLPDPFGHDLIHRGPNKSIIWINLGPIFMNSRPYHNTAHILTSRIM